jgi:hypothetical protein
MLDSAQNNIIHSETKCSGAVRQAKSESSGIMSPGINPALYFMSMFPLTYTIKLSYFSCRVVILMRQAENKRSVQFEA